VVARSIHVRLDDASELALSILRNAGMTDSEAVRTALHEGAAKRRSKASLRAEAARLAADPANVAEMRAIGGLIEELSPESPVG
jgi:hypothetical protein